MLIYWWCYSIDDVILLMMLSIDDVIYWWCYSIDDVILFDVILFMMLFYLWCYSIEKVSFVQLWRTSRRPASRCTSWRPCTSSSPARSPSTASCRTSSPTSAPSTSAPTSTSLRVRPPMLPFHYTIYASPSFGEAYRDRRLTTNFELWVEIFCVPTCFHMWIPKPCLPVRLSAPQEKISP